MALRQPLILLWILVTLISGRLCRIDGLINHILSYLYDFVFACSIKDRIGSVKRVTNETNVAVKLNLDGVGSPDSSTGIPFLDHMLDVSIFNLTNF